MQFFNVFTPTSMIYQPTKDKIAQLMQEYQQLSKGNSKALQTIPAFRIREKWMISTDFNDS